MIRIDEVFISSFGKFKDFSLVLNSGFNGICEKNGYGKTTIAIFIKAMFFGLGKTRSSKIAENERKRYTPWESNEKFGGYIKFTFKNKQYKIERFFGKTQSGDTFALFDGHNVPNSDFSENVGFEIFEIDAESFERCLYIPQKDVVIDANDSLTSKLNKLVDNTDDYNNFDTASERLLDIQRQLVSTSRTRNVSRKIKILDEIDSTQEKLFSAQQSYLQAKEKQRQAELNKQELARAQNILQELKEKQRASDSKKALLSKAEVFLRVEANYNQAKARVDELVEKNADVSPEYIKDISDKIEQVEIEKQQVAKIQTEFEKEAEVPKQSKAPYVAFGLLALIIIVATAVFVRELVATPVLFALPVIALVIVGVLALNSKIKFNAKIKSIKNQKKQIKEKLDQQIAKVDDMQNTLSQTFANHKIFEPNLHVALSQLKNNKVVFEQAIENYRLAVNEWNQKKADPEFALAMDSGKIETVDYTAEIRRMDEHVLELSNQNARLQKEVEIFLSNANLASDFKNRIERLELALADTEEKAKLAEVTLACLQQAKTNISQSFMPDIVKNFNKYINIVTNGQYDRASLDDKFNLRLHEKNSYREFDYFSKGLTDLGMFCLRLALVDAMYGENLPFLILDDPFVNYDTQKLQMALQLLGERSKKCQIIYFTCHEA
ncbi:MAG: hypothetical protein IKA42_05595 [Clostridia bacterium]|nr:hypothetical protein [Clostridia bacterium]MBR2303259.1 hypothetical protein [Clostridia bacterium]